MVLAVWCIWSIASSIDVIRSLMSPRSNGVIKVRRPVRLVLVGHDLPAVMLDRVASRQQPAQGVRAGHERAPVTHEQLDEALLPGQEGRNHPSIRSSRAGEVLG